MRAGQAALVVVFALRATRQTALKVPVGVLATILLALLVTALVTRLHVALALLVAAFNLSVATAFSETRLTSLRLPSSRKMKNQENQEN